LRALRHAAERDLERAQDRARHSGVPPQPPARALAARRGDPAASFADGPGRRACTPTREREAAARAHQGREEQALAIEGSPSPPSRMREHARGSAEGSAAAARRIGSSFVRRDTVDLERSPLDNRAIAYLTHIQDHDITFGIGPAGTGKTYLAVACAVDALERDAVKRIVLVRPAVEAGERLGFLPGDFAQKVDPYLRPLYDALYDLMGFDKTAKLFERNTIEIAPLAYMRGRTLNHSFIILDEAQNTTPEQMKMFLTRIGFGSKAVVTGDITQIDLARGQKSGMVVAQKILARVRGIAFSAFKSDDVVRH